MLFRRAGLPPADDDLPALSRAWSAIQLEAIASPEREAAQKGLETTTRSLEAAEKDARAEKIQNFSPPFSSGNMRV